MMTVCTFFGHSDCHCLDRDLLKQTIEDQIAQGVNEFLVGHQGAFDSTVYTCLKLLKAQYPHIQYHVVLAYLPRPAQKYEIKSDTIYPEIEGHPKFAIDRPNRYLIKESDICLCYINHTWGGAYKYVRMAKRRNLKIINLGNLKEEDI